MPFECGMETMTPPDSRLSPRFYFYGLLFLIFDIELIFLVPWALAIRPVEAAGFLVGVLFIAHAALAFAYEWRKGALRCR